MDAAESADTGETRHHEADVANEWRSSESRPSEDWWVAVAPDGRLAAVGWVWPETGGEVLADHYVHPAHRRRGLGEAMLDAIELRADELPAKKPDGTPRRLVVWCEDANAPRRASLERRGFAAVRQYFEMAIDLRGELAAPVWPDGIVARGFRPGADDEVLYRADLEAFAEHHLFTPRGYDEWRVFSVDALGADVTLWWLAWDRDELAGFVIPIAKDGAADIDGLAVRKAWRGRGIGLALLRAAFGTLRERGLSVVRLMVDAQNVTNAVQVYEAAGMHVSRRFDVLERPLG